ncbi:MAG: polysaccharide biosynthesis C-terminal domain-containing protein [Bacteroidetes bacterium]|nr:polysaccharide biosynthesis C-terminal domain-containing protein [Bacteroidota bacterium]MBL7104063.1 polysaccharide biosynthesis C-terminal domain-containing protein [Bacteroidales bacterium]
MKLNNKEFFKLSFLYTAVAAFPPFLQLIVRPLIEGDDKLNAADFSQIEIAETIASLALIIAIFAMSNAISRFYYDYLDDKKKYKKLVSGIFNSIILRGFLVLIVAYIFKDQIGKIFTQPELQNFSRYGFAAIIIGINRAINITAFALYRNEKKVRRFLIFSFMLGLLRSGFQLIGVFYFDMSFVGYVYGSCIGSSLISISILIYTYYSTGFHFNFKFLKPVNQFALPLFEYAIVVWSINFADRYFLESTPTILGIYSQALLLGRGIEIILQGIQGASQPEMFRMMKEGIKKNMGEIKKLSHLLMAQTQFMIALAIIPAMAYCLIFKTDLKLAAGFIAIVFIRYILRTQYIVFSFPVYFEKKTKIFLYLNLIVLAINLFLLYLLVPVWGAYGAITAIMISQTIQVAGIYQYQKKIVNISWNINKLLVFPFVIIAIAIIMELLKLQANINAFITSSIVVVSILISLLILYKKEIRNIIAKGWKQYL